MELSDVTLFNVIAGTGSLSAAGRDLGMSPMAVSRRLAALERELGVRLFHRTTRALALTADGETFLPLARTMVQAEEAALAAFAEHHEGLRGMIRVTAPNRIGRILAVPVAMRLLEKNPRLQVDLNFTDGIVDIAAAGMDVALRVAPLQTSELIATKLADNPRVLCAAPSYVSVKGKPIRLSDIDDHSCLTLHAMEHWPFTQDGKIVAKRVSGRLAASSVDTIHAACVSGGGLALLTYWDVAQDLASGALMPIELVDAEPESLAIWAVLPTRHQMPQRVRAFLDGVRAEIAAFPPSGKPS